MRWLLLVVMAACAPSTKWVSGRQVLPGREILVLTDTQAIHADRIQLDGDLVTGHVLHAWERPAGVRAIPDEVTASPTELAAKSGWVPVATPHFAVRRSEILSTRIRVTEVSQGPAPIRAMVGAVFGLAVIVGGVYLSTRECRSQSTLFGC